MKKKILFILFIAFAAMEVNSQTIPEGYLGCFYGGLRSEYMNLSGDFNGDTWFVTDAASIFVPEIEPGIALGGQFGVRFRRFSWDLGYQVSTHDYNHVEGFSGSLNMHNIKFFGITAYLRKSSGVLNPYIGFDFSGTWININEGAIGINSHEGESGKAYFGGLVTGLGLGIEVIPAKNFSLKIETIPSWLILTDVKGITKDYWEVEQFSGFKINGSVGLYYYFGLF